MKMIYEAPLAEIIDFSAAEALAVISEGDENTGPKPEIMVSGKDW